jgi:hypothetical protein
LNLAIRKINESSPMSRQQVKKFWEGEKNEEKKTKREKGKKEKKKRRRNKSKIKYEILNTISPKEERG